jgi:hypothetical protein
LVGMPIGAAVGALGASLLSIGAGEGATFLGAVVGAGMGARTGGGKGGAGSVQPPHCHPR